MLMYFKKCKDDVWYDDWVRFTGDYSGKTGHSLVYAVIRDRIKMKLNETFPSIRHYSPELLYFDFKDPADEAFFLIWSNDGIEI
jgi:hypothetical protein